MGKLRQMLWTSLENGFEDQLRWEVEHSVPLLDTEDSQEAFQAFAERREPKFTGR
jgi:enoyl-CoA hydratase/carnithine racemase